MIIPGAAMGVTDYVYVAGVPANPDSITAVLYRWVGATRSASGVSVTATAVGSGEYRFTWTNDAGFARTDELELVALPVVSGVTYPATVWRSHGHVDAVMRGTDGANTTAPDNANIVIAAAAAAAVADKLPTTDYLAGAAADGGAAALDSAALALINKIEASTAGTVSGAGTDTEIFVGSNVTLTITVDADGNRSAVVVS